MVVAVHAVFMKKNTLVISLVFYDLESINLAHIQD